MFSLFCFKETIFGIISKFCKTFQSLFAMRVPAICMYFAIFPSKMQSAHDRYELQLLCLHFPRGSGNPEGSPMISPQRKIVLYRNFSAICPRFYHSCFLCSYAVFIRPKSRRHKAVNCRHRSL